MKQRCSDRSIAEMIYMQRYLLCLAQYICSTRYPGTRFVSDAMYKHFPSAGDVLFL